MCWILAAFKIIKTWLPEKAIERIKFLKRANIQEFVPLDQALKSWGGLDEYTFSFVPEVIDTSANSTLPVVANNNRKVSHRMGSILWKLQRILICTYIFMRFLF